MHLPWQGCGSQQLSQGYSSWRLEIQVNRVVEGKAGVIEIFSFGLVAGASLYRTLS